VEININKKQKVANMSLEAHLIAGAFAGFCSRLLSHPLDLLKIRLQLQTESKMSARRPKYRTLGQSFSKIYSEEGLRGFYKGHLSAQFLAISSVSLYFCSFEASKRFLDLASPDYFEKNEVQKNTVAGLISGFVTMVGSYPLDTLRTRFSAQQKSYYKSFPDAFRKIFYTEGLRSMYKGIVPALINNAPQSALFFGFYSVIENKTNERRLKNDLKHKNTDDESSQLSFSFVQKMISSSIAAAASKSVTYPLDFVQKRLQMQGFRKASSELLKATPSYNGFFDCVMKIGRQEGAMSFFKGFKVGVLRQAYMISVSMTVYEYCKHVLSV